MRVACLRHALASPALRRYRGVRTGRREIALRAIARTILDPSNLPTSVRMLPVPRLSFLRSCSLLALGLTLLGGRPGASGQEIPTSALDALRFRHIGPVGNRITSVSGVPGDRLTYYVGAASGGVWKTETGGLQWRPVFDDHKIHAIGEVAVSRSDPSIVWVGTGEPFIRSNVSIGNGVWRSLDAGESWEHMGLDATGRISRIIVHPTDPDVVYAAAMGHGYSPQADRGVYRTVDGGRNWEHVLFVDEETGASDLVMDPSNPRTLFAGTWQLAIRTWNRRSGGPGSAIHMSRDGGDTWTRLEGAGLPETDVGKIALCTSPDNPRRIYALIETGDGVPWEGGETTGGELWRSDDGGANWALTSYDRDLAGRTAYYSRCEVSPDNENEIFFLAAAYSYSLDGGVTSESAAFGQAPNWDHHDMWIDPTDGERQAVAGDGGVSFSNDRGRSWFRIQLPVAQMYHVTADDAIPYNVLGNRQDGPSTRGPSNSRLQGGFIAGGIPRGLWHTVGGGESGFATPDPTDPRIVWSSASGAGAGGGIVVRWNSESRQYRETEVWPETTTGHPADSVRYRFQWTFPLLISPHDNETVYVTSQHVHRTRNRGQSWEVISPDLTTNDRSRMGISGGLTPDNIGVEFCCVIYAFDESPLEEGVFWAGTNDGLVQVSRDGGESWTDVTRNVPDLPPDGVVRGIDASRHATGKAYMVIEHHQVGDFEARAYRTEDYGESWTPISGGIDDGVLSYTRSVQEDPVRPGLLYLGTEASLWLSFDDGDSWQSLHTNLPHSPMYGIVVQERFNDLVIGTYGRGFWILDDVTPLQQLTAEVAASPAHLFSPREAWRFRPVSEEFSMSDDQSDGENPPYGASISYWLRDGVDGPVSLEIADASGETVRELAGTGQAGVNRVWWDLRGEPIRDIRLRTKPMHADDFELGEERERPFPGGLFGGPGPSALLQKPGTYTVTLHLDGVEAEGAAMTRELEVLKDPHSEGSEEEIAEQFGMLTELRSSADSAAALVNAVESVRRQLLDVADALRERADGDDHDGLDTLAEAADSLEARFVEAEEGLFQLRATGTGQDGIRYPTRLMERLNYLMSAVSVADFRPTDSAVEVKVILEERLARIAGEISRLMEEDLAEFNSRLTAEGMRVIS